MLTLTGILQISGVYCIEFIPTGRKYIGSSHKVLTRLRSHKSLLARGNHPNPILQAYYNKYGASSFSVSVIEEVCDINQLLTREQYWINILNTVAAGFNILPETGSSRGWKATEEQKKRRSERVRGPNNPFYGHRHTKECRKHFSTIRKGKRTGSDNSFYGKKHTAETRAKISSAASQRETNPFKGRSWTEPELANGLKEMKQKLSAKFSGEGNPFYGKTHDRTKIGKLFRITDPEGNSTIVRNLRLWCETHNRRFEVMRSSHCFKRPTPDGWTVELID